MSAHWFEDFALATLQEQQLQLLAQNFEHVRGKSILFLLIKFSLCLSRFDTDRVTFLVAPKRP